MSRISVGSVRRVGASGTITVVAVSVRTSILLGSGESIATSDDIATVTNQYTRCIFTLDMRELTYIDDFREASDDVSLLTE